MLVLHRNINESVTLITKDGERIQIKVSSFVNGGVRLAFDADPGVMILRSELEDQQPPIIRRILRKFRQRTQIDHVESSG